MVPYAAAIHFIHIKITVMKSQLFKKAVFLISLLIIITHSNCKKDAGGDYQPPDASPPVAPPPVGTGWTVVRNVPDEFSFFGRVPDGSFDGDNFLLGINNDLFAITRK